MKSKHSFIFIIMLLTILSLSACSSQTKDESINLTFSQYYQNADDYDKIYPLLNEYFSSIQNAYNNSDKSDLDTFTLPNEYKDISNSLAEISNDNSGAVVDGKTNLSEEYLARLKLLEPYLRMEYYLAQKDLLIVGNSSSETSPNEDWFEKLNDLLLEIYMEYETGTGE